MTIDRDEWMPELASHDELFFKLYNRLPREFPSIRDLLLAGLWRTPKKSVNREPCRRAPALDECQLFNNCSTSSSLRR